MKDGAEPTPRHVLGRAFRDTGVVQRVPTPVRGGQDRRSNADEVVVDTRLLVVRLYQWRTPALAGDRARLA